MEKGFIIVESEGSDKDIAMKVQQIFEEYKGRVPLEEFRKRLIDRFRYNPTEIIEENVEWTERPKLEERHAGRLYEVKGGVVISPGFYTPKKIDPPSLRNKLGLN